MKNAHLSESSGFTKLPDAFPARLRHSDNDTPVPTWKQVTRSVDSINPAMIGHVARIIAGVEDEQVALDVWDGWSGSCRRSFALIVDKIHHEGWLESVGSIDGWPWDGGFFFQPHDCELGTLVDVLDAKTRVDGVYTRGSIRHGLPAYFSRWNHRGWKQGWMENDCGFASLHVGIFENGCAEVHLDLFNPLYTNGAPRSEVTSLPGLGSYNRKLFRLHREWDVATRAVTLRTSANFYHLMRGRVPLCF